MAGTIGYVKVCLAAVFFAGSWAHAVAGAVDRAPSAPSSPALAASVPTLLREDRFAELLKFSAQGASVPQIAAILDAAPIEQLPPREALLPGAEPSLLSALPVAMPQSASRPARSPLVSYQLTSHFGMRDHPILGGRRIHAGIDMGASSGTPVLATADGVVSKAERYNAYGLYVAIEHGGRMQTRYGHMSRLNVTRGAQVKRGDIIGFVGATGRATGPHLHYEVRIAGRAVDPLNFLRSR